MTKIIFYCKLFIAIFLKIKCTKTAFVQYLSKFENFAFYLSWTIISMIYLHLPEVPLEVFFTFIHLNSNPKNE